MSIISLADIELNYGHLAALQGVNLEVEEGEFIIVSGHTGSGKTSLMKVLAGVTRPTSGEYWFLGDDFLNLPQEQQRKTKASQIGYVGPSSKLIDELSVYDNLVIRLGIQKRSISEQIEEICGRFGVSGYLNRKVSELSCGEKGQILLVQAVIHEPKVLVLDEPFGFFDHPLAMKVITTLQEISMDHLVTIILAERDIRLHPFAHRIVRMKSGHVDEVLGERFDGATPPYMQI